MPIIAVAHTGFSSNLPFAPKSLLRPLEEEFLVRYCQKTKCGAGFSSTFVFRHLFLRQRSLNFITWNLVSQLKERAYFWKVKIEPILTLEHWSNANLVTFGCFMQVLTRSRKSTSIGISVSTNVVDRLPCFLSPDIWTSR